MAKWKESEIENEVRKYLAAIPAIKLLGCDIRCYYDQHERAEDNAILIKAYNGENLNYGCQGRGNVWQCLVVVQVIGTILDDASREKHNMILGAVEDALDDMDKTDLSGAGVTVHGILWADVSATLNLETIIGTSLPSLRVIYEK